MDEKLKQRLVGALVIISLAVIILPFIFDGRDHQALPAAHNIPEQPTLTLDIRKPDLDTAEFESVKAQIKASRESMRAGDAEQQALQQPLSDEKTGDSAAVSTTAPAKPVVAPVVAARESYNTAKQRSTQQGPKSNSSKQQPTKSSLADAFTVQVASFSSRDNAERLYRKLNKMGYAAYIQTGSNKTTVIHRVFVGPHLKRNMANAVANRLGDKFKLKALVVRYVP